MNRRLDKGVLRKGLIAAFLVLASGVQAADNRFQTLGEALMCMCGCTQLLGQCNMIACPAAEPMRKELQGHIDAGEDDATILAAFDEKYGSRVLSTPPQDNWFNVSVWVMPFVVLLGGAGVVIFFLRRLRKAAAAPAEAPPPVDASKYESEIEEELRKLTPED